MARSLPRPISAPRRLGSLGDGGSGSAASLAALALPGAGSGDLDGGADGDDGDDGGAFMPPHVLAASLAADPAADALLTGRSFSLSTAAKGAAALRLRSSTLQRTGYLDGRRIGGGVGGGAAPA